MARPRKGSNESEDDERSYSNVSDEDYDSDVSDEEDEEEDEEQEEEGDDELKAAEAKHKLVEADLAEIKKMMEEMDRIKMRLHFRLTRERSDSSHVSSSPSRRRSSVAEIFVPPTVAAAVQTTWDMPRMYEVEKIISSTERTPPPTAPTPEQRAPELPVGPSVQLSLADLAKSYGVEDAVLSQRETAHPSFSVQASFPPKSAMEGYPPHERETTRPNSSLWDGLVMGGAAASNHSSESSENSNKPPKLNRSQLTPDSESSARPASPVDSRPTTRPLEDSFGVPASPTHTETYRPTDSTSSANAEAGKTMEQKEMEAMKNLLFF